MFWSGFIKEAKKLTYEERKNLPDSAFALPEKRKYPIHDESHARNALARAEQHADRDTEKKIIQAVKNKYPNIDVESKPG